MHNFNISIYFNILKKQLFLLTTYNNDRSPNALCGDLSSSSFLKSIKIYKSYIFHFASFSRCVPPSFLPFGAPLSRHNSARWWHFIFCGSTVVVHGIWGLWRPRLAGVVLLVPSCDVSVFAITPLCYPVVISQWYHLANHLVTYKKQI